MSTEDCLETLMLDTPETSEDSDSDDSSSLSDFEEEDVQTYKSTKKAIKRVGAKREAHKTPKQRRTTNGNVKLPATLPKMAVTRKDKTRTPNAKRALNLKNFTNQDKMTTSRRKSVAVTQTKTPKKTPAKVNANQPSEYCWCSNRISD